MDQEACKNHGIEYEDGLARFVGNVALYEKFLKQFPDDPCYKQLKEALDKQDIDTAFQAAHTLKGVTGNLSMKDLYDKVCVVVEQLRIKDLS